jgi:predicted acyl esterase
LQAAAAPASFGHYQPPKQFTDQVHSTFYVRLRDGTRLGVTVARPAVNGQAAPGRFR